MSLPVVTGEFRAADDPDVRFAASGTAVATVRLVANSSKKDPSGSWVEDKTLWITATCFGKQAENLVDSVVKGDLVTVSGRLVTESWEAKDGGKRSDIRLLVDTIGVSLRFRRTPHGAHEEAEAGPRQPSAPARGSQEGSGGSGPQRGAQEPSGGYYF